MSVLQKVAPGIPASEGRHVSPKETPNEIRHGAK